MGSRHFVQNCTFNEMFYICNAAVSFKCVRLRQVCHKPGIGMLPSLLCLKATTPYTACDRVAWNIISIHRVVGIAHCLGLLPCVAKGQNHNRQRGPCECSWQHDHNNGHTPLSRGTACILDCICHKYVIQGGCCQEAEGSCQRHYL